MKFKFLGTAAFEAIPALFCNCETCEKAREIGGKSVRTRSQALIDDCLMIDFPPDTLIHIQKNNIDMNKVRNCLITHSHSDHLYVGDMEILGERYASTSDDYSITYYATKIAGKQIEGAANDISKVRLHNVKPFDSLKADKYSVTVLPAIHDEESGPVIYQIDDGENKVLYALDTDFLHDDIWKYWERTSPYFNLVVLDCTNALKPLNYLGEHMSFYENIKVKNKMLSMGVAGENTKFVSNHFSHNGYNVLYEEFCEIAAKEGFLVSYDGMEIYL